MKTNKDKKSKSRLRNGLVGGMIAAMALAPTLGFAQDEQPVDRVRLYVLDGGTLTVSDMDAFADDGSLKGRKGTLANPSFLIRHPQGDLLWDTGYSDELAKQPDGSKDGVWHSRLEWPLVRQLADLKLKPKDIEYLALSHLHPDHSGNGNLFVGSTFLVQEDEREFMFSDANLKLFGEAYGDLASAETRTFETSLDVFGDGKVILFAMPGHTPGSAVLLVRLETAGSVLLSGDLYTYDGARKNGTVPSFNLDRERTLTSRRAFEALATREKARVVVQHSRPDIAALPVPPSYLD